MTRVTNELGNISISNQVYTSIAGIAAINCFGVKGMAHRSVKDGLVHLLRREYLAKGVHITNNDDGSISIDLHIIVDHGINIAAVSASIIEQVGYQVTKATGTPVQEVNVLVDYMTME